MLYAFTDTLGRTTGIQNVFFFGVGDAAQGLMRFLAVRGPGMSDRPGTVLGSLC